MYPVTGSTGFIGSHIGANPGRLSSLICRFTRQFLATIL